MCTNRVMVRHNLGNNMLSFIPTTDNRPSIDPTKAACDAKFGKISARDFFSRFFKNSIESAFRACYCCLKIANER